LGAPGSASAPVAPAPDFRGSRGCVVEDPWECGQIRPGDSCCSFCPCESWWSCGCTQDTIYRTSSIHYKYNIDYYSSLSCVYRQPVLKIKNFCRGIRENQPNTAEVGLRDRVRIIGNPDVRTVKEIREMSSGETLYCVQLGSDFVTRVWAKESDLVRPD